ncbi:TolC family outer membrane protein [Zavarzinia sp.]|uniref:TolC family outer membrane protein n=1 Tax=Zavarzinia sp. TaxID=2027920 RepID=UPI003565E7AC
MALLAFGGAMPALAESLPEALASAYATNPTLEAQRASLRATDEEIAKALSGWRPTVTVQGSIGHTSSDSKVKGISASTDYDPWSIALQGSQPIYRGGRTIAETSAAENQIQAGRAQLKSTEQQVLLAVVNAYVNVQTNQAVVELNQKNVTVLQRELDASRDRFRVGEVTRTDVAQAEARLAAAVSTLKSAEADLNAARQAYEKVVGHAPGTLSPVPQLPPLPPSNDEVRAVALAENPDLIAARYAEAASRDAVDVATSAIKPQVALTGTVARVKDQSASTVGVTTNQAEVAVQVTVPLYQSGSEYATIRQQQQTASQRLSQVSEAQRTVIEGASNANNQLQAARAVIVSQQQAVQANTLALEGVRQEASVGSRTVLDVLNAEQELLNSQVALVRAQGSEQSAAYSLLSAIGRLTAENLNLSGDRYDSTKHYDSTRGRWIGFD